MITVKTLVLGAGGGYDIYTALPWFLSLARDEQERCLLANYTFTDDIHKYTDSYIAEITPSTIRTEKNTNYFPEHHLAQKLNRTIYTFRLMPCPLLVEILKGFIEAHQIEQIYLFDGGTDSVIFGDEKKWGSPLEDSQTVLACYRSGLPCKLYASALGIDDCEVEAFHRHRKEVPGPIHRLGPELLGWQQYREIVQTSQPPSIIQESIIAAGEGHRGRYKNSRLIPSRIEHEEDLPIILDETNLLYEFNLHQLVEASPFYQHLLKVTSASDWPEWDYIMMAILN